jgi:predicted nucleic acid-binding protein
MRVYLDTCCLNRLLDRSVQPRVRAEAQAVLQVLARVESGEVVLLGSDVLSFEIAQTPDASTRTRVGVLAGFAGEVVGLSEQIEGRADQLVMLGMRYLDALHVASAEVGHADAFLTTDDRLIRAAARAIDQVRVPVVNPTTWMSEGTKR